jgi:hypothetical protein
MWLLALAIFIGCKWLTWRRTPIAKVPWRLQAGYLFAWPGLDAKAFLTSGDAARTQRPALREWFLAIWRLVAGIMLFWGAHFIVPEELELLLGWLGMIGVILMLHFGSFHLLSCAWRASGVNARPLMDRPLASVRLGEFWGQRWNTAFRDFTYRFLFRPLTAAFGPRWGLAAGFLFSGLVHDLVISVPADGGYGGPTVFFIVQSVGMLTERSPFGRRIGLGRGLRGWVFTMAVLSLPAYWLFHPLFVRRIVVPFMMALSAA